MKDSRKIIVYVIVAVAVLGILFGWRNYQMNKINGTISGDGLSLIDSGLTSEDVPSIDSPKFTDVASSDEVLGDDLFGIDFEVGGAHRFYPIQILNWHQVVNDSFGVEQIAVTFDPLTFSPAVYSRVVDGEVVTFNISGQVYNNNSILTDDQTGRNWLQLTGEQVDGDGTLDLLPSEFMSWADWKVAYPNGEVLSTETGVVRDYTRHPYGSYDVSKTIYFPLDNTVGLLSPKWVVTSYLVDGQAVSFSQKVMDGKGILEAEVGGRSLVAFLDYEQGNTRIFDRNADTHFKYDFDKHQITDQATGSVWSPLGLCLSGELKGTELARLPSYVSYWFAWSATFPESQVGGLDQVGNLND